MITYINNQYKLNEKTLTDSQALDQFTANVSDWSLSAYRAISKLLDKVNIEDGDPDDYKYLELRNEISLENLEDDIEEDTFHLHLWDEQDRRIYVASERNLPNGKNYLEEVYSSLCNWKTKFESWHTLEYLMIARQAHRENSANLRLINLPYNPSKEEFEQYLEASRVADELHHGKRTF